MIDQETRKAAMFEAGKAAALALQEKASTMDGTQLNDAGQEIPDFQAAKKVKNMLNRTAGKDNGFVCKTSAGRVVRLLQAYDSDTYPQEPEELPAQWSFVWSQDPAHALPFISLATSHYNIGDCCTENGKVYRSNHENNIWAPSEYGAFWDLVEEEN